MSLREGERGRESEGEREREREKEREREEVSGEEREKEWETFFMKIWILMQQYISLGSTSYS